MGSNKEAAVFLIEMYKNAAQANLLKQRGLQPCSPLCFVFTR
jgi:hypothetical protein